MRISISYNAEADTAYVRFGLPRDVARSISPFEDLVLDLDAEGWLAGIEFVTASRLLDEETLLDVQRDELLGVTQIAALLGKAKQNVAQHYTRRPDFPAPAEQLPTGRYWRREDVEKWIAARSGEPRGARDSTESLPPLPADVTRSSGDADVRPRFRAPRGRRLIPKPAAEPSEASARMSRQRRRDTGPEVALRSELHRRGLRFRIHRRPLAAVRREADIVFPQARVAVFIDGCFWHGCPEHRTHPQRNASFWLEKIEGNRMRDSETDKLLRVAGWVSIRVWEHESVTDAADRVAAAVRAAQR